LSDTFPVRFPNAVSLLQGYILRITFAFADRTLEAVQFARLMLDIQHLCAMTAGLASLNSLQPYLPSFEESSSFKYSALIELPPHYFGYAGATVARIRQESPLIVELLVGVPKALAGFFKENFETIYRRFFYGDLERAKRTLELENMREDIRGKRIKNLESVFDLAQKIPDARLRRQFLQNLDSSIVPFLTEHPPIRSVDLDDDVT
jgi:hypothetical protein